MNITLYFAGYSMLGFLISTSPLRLLPLEFPANRELMIDSCEWFLNHFAQKYMETIKSRFMIISLCDLQIYKLLHCSKHAWLIYISSSLVFSFYPVTQPSTRRCFGYGVEHVEKGKKGQGKQQQERKREKFSSCSRVVFYPMFFHLPIMSLIPVTPPSFFN